MTESEHDAVPAPLTVAGVAVRPGRRRVVDIPAGRLVTGAPMTIEALVVNGTRPGPTLWLTAAVHGDELNGIEIVRRIADGVTAGTLAGSLIAVPIVNVFGVVEGSRYMPDRRDLNRAFPGSSRGSLAARLARLIVDHVVAAGTVGIDFHTATDNRINLPQIRVNLDDPDARRLGLAFGAPVLLHARMRDGSLRQAAADMGKTVLVFEGGQAARFEEDAVQAGVEGTLRVMAALGMDGIEPALGPAPVEARSSSWIRARRSGILRLRAKLGDLVEPSAVLGEIGDTFAGRRSLVRASSPGIVVGLNAHPLVNRGDALVHIAHVSEPGHGS